jgi:predicted membrane GTPase involved in stress response
MQVTLLKADGNKENYIVDRVYVNQGLKRVEVEEGASGDIIAIQE